MRGVSESSDLGVKRRNEALNSPTAPADEPPPSASSLGLSAYEVPTFALGATRHSAANACWAQTAALTHSDRQPALAANRNMQLRHHHGVAALQQNVLIQRPPAFHIAVAKATRSLLALLPPQDLDIVQRRE